jgi:protein-tyrosine phosphatase
MTNVFAQVLEAGIVPIITHPERTPCLQSRSDLLRTWVANGCLIQVTGDSVLGRFGRTAQSIAESLLREDLAHIIASDGHDTRHRPPVLQPAYDCVRKKWGSHRADDLFTNYPRKVLAGERITLKKGRKSGESRVWFRFGAVAR